MRRRDTFRTYLGIYIHGMYNESGTYEAECSRKVASGRRIADAIRSLVNARSLQLECVRILHGSLLVVPVLKYGSETMVWREVKD